MASEEHSIQKEIQVALSQHKCSVFRTNVGKVMTIDHRWFDTGLPQGFPDLMGYRWVDNQIFFIEVNLERIKLDFMNFLHHIKLFMVLLDLLKML